MSTIATPPKVSSKRTRTGASALHIEAGSDHFVGIGNIRVIVVNDGSIWFAQGLEIDYAADGKSLEETKTNFREGLCQTIHLHIQAYGNLDKFLKIAPGDAWRELWKDGTHLKYSQVSLHKDMTGKVKSFPFTGIQFIEKDAA